MSALSSTFPSPQDNLSFLRGPHEYTLVLKPDLYSKRHVQWFYFRVSNMDTKPIYTFHIVNFEKSKSLYSKGWPMPEAG